MSPETGPCSLGAGARFPPVGNYRQTARLSDPLSLSFFPEAPLLQRSESVAAAHEGSGTSKDSPRGIQPAPAELGGASRVLLLGMVEGFCSASVSQGSFPPLRLPCSLPAPLLSCRDFTDCLLLGWGPCESPLLASVVLAPAVSPALGTVSMNQRMIEWLP